jgi:hypothetical protein
MLLIALDFTKGKQYDERRKYAKKKRILKVTTQSIKLNGKYYHPVTGEVVKDVTPSVATAVKSPTTLNHTKRHAPQTSQTLMRRAVKKPKAIAVNTISPLGHPDTYTVKVKQPIKSVNPSRLQRAQSIAQSPHVSRYAQHSNLSVAYASIPVQPEPKIVENEAPVAPPPLQTFTASEMFERAIERATNYVDIAAERAHFNKKKRAHALHMATGLTALALFAGFAFYQNSSMLQIKAAGLRSGLARSTPNLQATGFQYAGVQTAQDTRVLGLSDSAGNYQLRQTPTNWSGAAMIHSVSSTDASGVPNHETLSFAGTTVYRLTSGTYTWVKNGVWYQFTPTDGHKEIPLDKLSALIQNS